MSPPWKKTFYALCIAQFIAMLGFSFVMPFLSFYIKHLPVPIPEGPEADKWAGIIMMAGGLPMVVFSPIWGLLADRYGRKPMVLRAMLGGAVVIALMGCAQNITHLLILRILQGMLTGTVGASMALAASVTPKERAGTVLGTLIVSSTSGQYIGPVLGGYSAKFFGYEPTFFLAGGILVLGGLIVQFAVRETFTRSVASKTDVRGSFLPLLTTGAFVVPVVTLCLINFSATAPGPIFPYFVKRISAMSDAEAGALTGLILSIVGPVEASSAWIFGAFGDRWGQKRVLMFCVVWGGIMASLQAYSQTIGQLILIRVLFGFGMAGIFPTASALIRKVAPEQSMGKAFGIVSSVTSLGWSLGPLVGAYFSVFMRSYRATFTLSGELLLFVSLFIAWRVRHPTPVVERREEGVRTLEPALSRDPPEPPGP
jgi:DHA1 family multidrug resistance protein-like MFS transporter